MKKLMIEARTVLCVNVTHFWCDLSSTLASVNWESVPFSRVVVRNCCRFPFIVGCVEGDLVPNGFAQHLHGQFLLHFRKLNLQLHLIVLHSAALPIYFLRLEPPIHGVSESAGHGFVNTFRFIFEVVASKNSQN